MRWSGMRNALTALLDTVNGDLASGQLRGTLDLDLFHGTHEMPVFGEFQRASANARRF